MSEWERRIILDICKRQIRVKKAIMQWTRYLSCKTFWSDILTIRILKQFFCFLTLFFFKSKSNKWKGKSLDSTETKWESIWNNKVALVNSSFWGRETYVILIKRSGASLHHEADFGRVGEYMKQEEPAALPHKNQVHYPQRTYQMKENTTYIWNQKSYCLWEEKHSPSAHTHTHTLPLLRMSDISLFEGLL